MNNPKVDLIRSVKLDDHIGEKLEKLDLIISDTQGHDHKALIGFKSNILKYKPIIICEFTPVWIKAHGSEPEAVLKLYESWGYQITPVEFDCLSGEIISTMKQNALVECNLVLRPRLVTP